MNAGVKRVLVTDGNAKSTLTIVRSLARRGIEVHVAAEASFAIAAGSRFAARRHRVPVSKRAPADFVDALLRLNERWAYSAVIPVSDFDIAALLDAGPERTAGLRMALPGRDAFRDAWDKSRMMRLAVAAGVPCPESYFPDLEPVESIARRAKYPVLVKPNISAGARGIAMVAEAGDLAGTLERVTGAWGSAHVQEYIPPGGGQFKSEMVVGAAGRLLALFVCEKLRFFPVEGGSSTLIAPRRHAGIEDAVRRLAGAMNWYGFADFDFIVDPRDGVAKLMECNPRFPESLAINVHAGADFPWCMYQLASTGSADPIRDYALDRFARFLAGDVMWFRHSPDRWRARPSFFRFFAADTKYYVEQWDDPGPAACYVIQSLATLVSAKKKAYFFGRGFSRAPSR